MSKSVSSKYSYKHQCAMSVFSGSRLLDLWRVRVRAISEFRDALDERVSKDFPF